jgi:NAD(P)-dependent dehydrogenase (short-subunit alcohol dehydrogenase family)
MQLMVIGASRGLGRAFVEGLANPGDFVTGVSRSGPADLDMPQGVGVRWISTDLSDPQAAAHTLEREAPDVIDALIYNVGIWEPEAFGEDYSFLSQSDTTSLELIEVNVASTILILKRLLPRLLASGKPRLILTGSTSALPGNGRPEVAFGASKTALTGIASALREGFRSQRLGVTLLQLGYLNTDDSLSVPVDEAAARGDGEFVPVHDVVAMVKAMLSLSPSSFVRELVLPAVKDSRF